MTYIQTELALTSLVQGSLRSPQLCSNYVYRFIKKKKKKKIRTKKKKNETVQHVRMRNITLSNYPRGL